MFQSLTGYVIQADVGATGDPRVPQPFAVPAGETSQIDLTVLTITGAAYNLTGAQVLLSVRDRLGNSIISRQATINAPPSAGTCFFPLTNGDTASLAGALFSSTFQYDISVTDSSGNFYKVIKTSLFVVSPAQGLFGQAVTVPPSQSPLGQGPPGLGVAYTFQTSAYSARFLDLVVGDPTSGAFNVTLPLISTLQSVSGSGMIVIVHGSASANAIGVVPSGSDKILISGAAQSLYSVNQGAILRLLPAIDGVRGNRWVVA